MLYSRRIAAILFATAALSLTAHSQIKGSACPAREGGKSLTTVDLFDGPPSEMADLVPDASHGTKHNAVSSWDVAYIFDKGAHVFLVCQYASPDRKITVEVEKKVQRCIYKIRQHTPPEVSCK